MFPSVVLVWCCLCLPALAASLLPWAILLHMCLCFVGPAWLVSHCSCAVRLALLPPFLQAGSSTPELLFSAFLWAMDFNFFVFSGARFTPTPPPPLHVCMVRSLSPHSALFLHVLVMYLTLRWQGTHSAVLHVLDMLVSRHTMAACPWYSTCRPSTLALGCSHPPPFFSPVHTCPQVCCLSIRFPHS